MNKSHTIEKNKIEFYEQMFIIGVENCCYNIKELLDKIKLANPKVKVIAISNNDCSEDWLNLFKWGVSGYIQMEQIEGELITAIIQVNKNGIYLPKNNHARFIKEVIRLKEKHPSHYEMILNKAVATQLFSQRECDVFELMIQGKTALEMSKMLYISKSTVNDHIDAIFKILNVNNRISAIVHGLKMGLIH